MDQGSTDPRGGLYAKLCQGGKGRYVGREGILAVDNCSGGKCVPVIVFESLDLSVCYRVYVS